MLCCFQQIWRGASAMRLGMPAKSGENIREINVLIALEGGDNGDPTLIRTTMRDARKTKTERTRVEKVLRKTRVQQEYRMAIQGTGSREGCFFVAERREDGVVSLRPKIN